MGTADGHVVDAAALADAEDHRRGRLALARRRLVVGVLTAALLAALAGWAGPRTATRRASDGPWSVEVTYAAVARAGLDVPWTVTVTHDGGFDGPVELAVSADYLDLFESQGFRPEPASWRATDETVLLELDPPPTGDVLRLRFDAYVQPAAQRGASGTVAVVDDGPRAAVAFSTILLP